MIGGYPPLEFLADAADRIRHVHLKDTILDKALPVLHGERSIMQGVQDGMFCAMGRGDVPIAEIVMSLERSGYDRWYERRIPPRRRFGPCLHTGGFMRPSVLGVDQPRTLRRGTI